MLQKSTYSLGLLEFAGVCRNRLWISGVPNCHMTELPCIDNLIIAVKVSMLIPWRIQIAPYIKISAHKQITVLQDGSRSAKAIILVFYDMHTLSCVRK